MIAMGDPDKYGGKKGRFMRKEQRRNIRYLKREEWEELKSSIDNYRDELIIELLYSTGMRVGELSNLSIAEYVFSVPPGNLAIFQVRMLSIFSRSLGAVFTLAGLATIALARNRLSLAKDAYRMAKVIQSGTEEYQA